MVYGRKIFHKAFIVRDCDDGRSLSELNDYLGSSYSTVEQVCPLSSPAKQDVASKPACLVIVKVGEVH